MSTNSLENKIIVLDVDTTIQDYLEQLEEVEKLTLKTAEQQLGSSFDISKSIGFLEWRKL